MRAIPSLTLLPTVLLALVAPLLPAHAQDGDPNPPALAPAVLADLPLDRVHWDEPGDGATWVRGADYKASFGPRGAQYVPYFGPRQPENVVLSFSPARVRVAGQVLAFDGAAQERRAGEHVEFDRGSFVERWEIGLDAVEQSFVFASLPALGELEITIQPGDQLEGSTNASGIVLAGELGRVEYSRAVAIDADGRRADAPTEWVDGAIVIRVPETFVRGARFPLVVDPVISTHHYDSTTSDTFSPDATWSPSDNAWMIVYTVVYSATDNDVLVRHMTQNGTISPGSWVDFTTSSWNTPRCAAIQANDRMLVVAENSTVVPKGIWGRPVIFSGPTITMASQIDVAGTTGGDKTQPDVGGDGSVTGFRYALVTWTSTVAPGNSEIGYALVDANGTVAVGPYYLAHTVGTQRFGSSVSKSNGGRNWLVAFVHFDGFLSDIMAVRFDDDGTLINAPFFVANSNLVESWPCVSSPLTGTDRNLVAFRQNTLTATQSDIGVVALDGTTVLQRVNLSVLENSGTQGVDQTSPSVDSNGSHFVLAYSEKVPAFGYYDLYATDLILSGSEIRVAQSHVLAYNISLPVLNAQVAAASANSPIAQSFLIPFDIEQNSTDHDCSAVVFGSLVGGITTPYCFGDGTGTACPCGNSGAAGHGCAHSASSTGASLLKIGGIESVASDSLFLQAQSLPSGAPVLFFQGTLPTAGSAFGDGLLCLGGTIVRLGVVFATGTNAFAPAGLAALGGVPAGGGRRAYQAWYRDASPTHCSSSTFNLTNGVQVDWIP